MKRFARPTCALLTLGLLCCASAAARGDAVPPEQRLATQLSQAAYLVLQQQPLSLEALEIATIIAEEAVNLVPEDPEMWRLAYRVATLAERDELRVRAMERIAVLDPADEVARLRWVSRQLRRHQTVEEMAGALERLLTDANRERLGPAVSSRLALDLALLERRRGEDQRFADRLAQAVALDPSNQHAVSLAAGYFQMHVNDPAAEGELLVQLLLSNPISVENTLLLAAHLLGHGAYEGAHRFYEIALRAYSAMHTPAPVDLVADAAIARFGRGDAEGAMRQLADRQREANVQLQYEIQRARPELTPRERAAFVAGLSPTFSTVRAAIQRRAGLDVAAQVSAADGAYDAAIEQLAQVEEIDESERQHRTALLRSEQAWVLIWLGGAAERVDEVLEAARAIADLSETAEHRFNGWRALRAGEHETAITILEQSAPNDAPSRLGRGLAMIETGRPRDGARELLAVARAQPGTLIGAYAADVLAELLGRRVPLTNEAAELEAIAARFPRALDRIMSEPTTALALNVVPSDSRLPPHSPLIVHLEITNNSPVPLAIDPSGPIQPEVVLLPMLQVVGARAQSLPPLVVGIDRRLRLMPRERLVIPVDLRRTYLGKPLNQVAIAGAVVRLRGVTNFQATRHGAIITGVLGSESRPPSIWIDGVRLTPQWMDESLAAMRDFTATDSDLTRLALFGMAVAGEPSERVSAAEQRVIDAARQTVAEAFARVDAVSQAWLLAVWPIGSHDRVAPVERYADDRLVHLAHLLFRVRDPNDPLVNHALRSDDRALRRVASIIGRGAVGDDLGGLRGDPANLMDE